MKSLVIPQYHSVRILPLSYRPLATDGQVTSYDPESADFRRIAAKAIEGEPGCQYGPEFIVECDGEIVSLHLGVKGDRGAAKYLYAYLPSDTHGPTAAILTRLGERLYVSPAAVNVAA